MIYIVSTLLKSKLVKSRDSNLVHPANIPPMSVTFDVSSMVTSIDVKFVQSLNNEPMPVAFEVTKFDTSIAVSDEQA